jgi:hypothetical protein
MFTLILAMSITVFSVLNILIAVAIGYTVAAGADHVYHGVELEHLARYMVGVGFLGACASGFSWLGYDVARDR